MPFTICCYTAVIRQEEKGVKNRSLSIPEWHALALEGKELPVRILINGVSMFPLIRRNRDYVTIMPLRGEPAEGDIVMFLNPRREGGYVLHRVWKVRDGRVLTWGDNCKKPDGWLQLEDIWGKAVLIERGGKRIVPDPEKGLSLAKAWHVLGREYRWGEVKAAGAMRRARRVKELASQLLAQGDQRP